jgi:hypothetical protein
VKAIRELYRIVRLHRHAEIPVQEHPHPQGELCVPASRFANDSRARRTGVGSIRPCTCLDVVL